MSETLAPLSCVQESLWLIEQVSGQDAPVYNESLAFAIDGPLDIGLLRDVLARVVARHEALRTVFVETSDGLQAVVRERVPEAGELLEILDLSGSSDVEQARDRAGKAMRDSYRRPFDLARGPLVRGLIVRTGEQEALFGLTVHHIVIDGWSLGLLLEEISAHYTAAVGEGKLPDSAPAPAYRAYARRERDAVASGAFEGQIAAWRELLKARPPLLEIPTDRPRSATRTYRGATRTLRVPRARFQPLFDRCAQDCGSTDFAVLMAVHALLMYRLSGQEEVTVGTTVLNRHEVEDLSTVGCFVNTAALPLSFGECSTFRQLVTHTIDRLTRVLDLQEAPYAKVLEALDIPRDPSHNPVFQTMLTLLGERKNLRLGPDLRTRPHRIERVASKFDLMLYVSEDGEELEFEAEFNTDLFDPESIERFLHRFAHTAESVAADLDTDVRRVSILPEDERDVILGEWNDTDADFPGTTVIDAIEAQAERTPDAVAVEFGDVSLTYGELDAAAGAVARALLRGAAGDGNPDGFIGVYMERSIEMVVALLAVVKAGLAYVPIDPEYPADRARYMIEDSAAPLILTQEKFRATLDEMGARSAILAELTAEGQSADAPPDRRLTPDSRVYMIYTSGSTGRPKGVVNRHASLHNRLAWMQARYPLTSEDRVLQKTPFSFDVSVWEFFWPLMAGARIVVAEPGGHRDPEYLAGLVRTHQVTTTHFVPSMLNVFLEQDGLRDACGSLRRVFCSGEALPHDTVAAFATELDCELHNLYGPTEAAIDVSFWAATPDYPGRIVPIGRPIANTHLYVMDRDLRLQPIGVPGELCIGGTGLAEGYHNRPDLTAAAFLDGPFADVPDQRLYRTGDLARFLADGNIEYLGRIDNQVKLHGLRIELGEIEAALRQLPDVREAAVVLHEDAGRQALVAYVAATGFDSGQAVEALRERLPDFMVPQWYIEIPALPLSANGKLDRRALPDPRPHLDPNRHAAGSAEARGNPPSTAAERAVATAWSEVLGMEDIDVDANFFRFGGDSIQGIRIASRLRDAGYRVSVQDIFRHFTVRQLAACLDEVASQGGRDAEAEAARQALEPFRTLTAADRAALPPKAEDAWPLTRLQSGMVYHSMLHEGSSVYHDIFTYDFSGPLRRDLLREAVTTITARHGQLRSRFDLGGYSEALQLVLTDHEPELEFADVSGLGAAEQSAVLAEWIELEKSRDFDLEEGPLVRFRATLRAADRFTLTISFHHAVLDGWSVALVIEQIRAVYAALLERRETERGETERGETDRLSGQLKPLPLPLPLPYSAYVLLERRAVADAGHAAFWASVVADGTPTLLAGPAPAQWQAEPASAARVVPESTATGLRRLADEVGVPVKSVYLALHLHVLAQLTGRSEALTGLVVNGRPEVDGGERSAGLFLNTVPVAGNVATRGDWAAAVRGAFESERRALAHRRYPLSEILRNAHAAGVDGELFDTVFNFTDFHVYEGAHHPDVPASGVTIVGARYFEQTSFPVVVHVARDPFAQAMTLTVNYDSVRVRGDVADRYLEGLLHAARALTGRTAPPPSPSAPAATAPDELIDGIRAVVAEVLGADRVGPHDEFVPLGMDSIRAIRVVAKVRRLGVKVALPDLFEHPTAAALAAHLEGREDSAGAERPNRPGTFELAGRPRAAFPAHVVDAYPATAIQLEMIRRFTADQGQAVYHDVFGYRLGLRLDADLLRACLRRLIDRHDTLRTAFDLGARPAPLQLVHDQVDAKVEVEDLSALDAKAQQAAYDDWFEAEKETGFAWDRPPLMRFAAHRLSDREFILSLSFHHAVIDGWSLSLLVKEFVGLYTAALERGTPGEVRPATQPYRHYVAQESAERRSPEARRFWAEYLRGAEPRPLPAAAAQAAKPGSRWSETKLVVEPGTQSALTELARRAQAPLKHVLLAAHAAVLSRLHGEDKVMTHVFAGGRLEEEGGDETLGLFLNFTPLRVDTGGRSWQSLITEVFENERRILPYRRYPLPDIERDLSVDWLAETAFNYTRFASYGEVARQRVLSGVRWFEHTHFPLLVNVGHDIHQERIIVTLNADARRASHNYLTELADLYRTVLDDMTGDTPR